MKQPKIALLILLLIAGLFVLSRVIDLGNADTDPNSGAASESLSTPWTQAIGTLLSPLSPQIDLGHQVFEIPAGQPYRDPQTGRSFIVISRSSQRLRTARLQLTAGDALQLSYHDQTENIPENLQQQEKTLTLSPDEDKASIVAFSQGGTLDLFCVSSDRCTLEMVSAQP